MLTTQPACEQVRRTAIKIAFRARPQTVDLQAIPQVGGVEPSADEIRLMCRRIQSQWTRRERTIRSSFELMECGDAIRVATFS